MALTHDNAMDILAGVDLVVDASDNPRTRYLVNDACVLSGKPLVRVLFNRFKYTPDVYLSNYSGLAFPLRVQAW